MIVFPVPDDEYVIDYSYMYRHPELATATDTLDGVPPEVVDKIVELAAGAMKGNFDRLINEAEIMSRRSERSVDEIHKRHRGMSADRARVGNWDGEASRFHDGYSITQGRRIGGN